VKEQTAETIVGALVALVAIGFLSFALARAGGGEGAGGYPLIAKFNRVDGISVGSDVRLSGVKVGAVSAVDLDPMTYMAKLTMSFGPGVKVPEDSTAKVVSDGLLGGAYIAVEPGGAEAMLARNGEFSHTQGPIDLFTVLASAMGGGAAKAGDGAEQGVAP
jgi:phospholipid/cholesterol/gamma-HCH transport system substrate-binding protein